MDVLARSYAAAFKRYAVQPAAVLFGERAQADPDPVVHQRRGDACAGGPARRPFLGGGRRGLAVEPHVVQRRGGGDEANGAAFGPGPEHRALRPAPHPDPPTVETYRG